MDFDAARERMIAEQLLARGIRDARLLAAFRRVPRHQFVPPAQQAHAYDDTPMAIGSGQTISQPYMAALTLDTLRLQGHERVLEIGTGSGYQTALLAFLALEVYSIERLPELAARAADQLATLSLINVELAVRDGTLGWSERAPFDAIAVAAGAPRIPRALREQLADGGRMAIPLGTAQTQTLYVVERHGIEWTERAVTACVFVPLVGQDGWME